MQLSSKTFQDKQEEMMIILKNVIYLEKKNSHLHKISFHDVITINRLENLIKNQF
jgi:hypothetical protein